MEEGQSSGEETKEGQSCPNFACGKQMVKLMQRTDSFEKRLKAGGEGDDRG